MSTSPHRAEGPWSGPEQEYDLLVQEARSEPLEHVDSPVVTLGSAQADYPGEGFEGADNWRAGRDELYEGRVGEYVSMPGLPARGVVLTSLVTAGGCAVLDLMLTSRITMFFDLCFIVVCLVSAMAVRRRDFFTTGVLPPMVFGAVVAAVAVKSPETFITAGGLGKAFMTGLAQHATALVIGYAVALATLGGRISAASTR